MKIGIERNCVVEIAFQSTCTYENPYEALDLDVVFTGPGNAPLRVPGFWAGDNLWKVRFSANEEGEYRYETVSTNRQDQGLHGQRGVVNVGPYGGDNPLERHGRLRVAADKRHFEHADGTPFFWVGDTWWMGLTKRLDWPQGVQTLAADRIAKGFNVVQIIAGPLPDMDAWDHRGMNEAGYPFEEGFSSINPAYYDLADLKIGHLADVGLVPCIVGMWGYYLPQIGVEKAKRFWRYIVARYGAYPVVWCICGEGTMPYYLSQTKEQDAAFQKKGWTDVMAHVRSIDVYRNMISIHPCQYGREMVEDPTLMDFEMLQTGHGDMDSVGPTAATVSTAVSREPRMPVVNSEVNYEGILGRAWQNVQRLCFYHSVLNGTAGHTYGANGIWQMGTKDAPYGPSPHGRCWGNTPWREAFQLPGSRQIGLGGAFMQRFPWWKLERHPEWLDPPGNEQNPYACIATGIPGALRIVYVPMLWDPPVVRHLERDVSYRAYYFDPCTGVQIGLGEVTPNENGDWSPSLPPEVHDWLLVLHSP